MWVVLSDLPITAAKSAARVQSGAWVFFYMYTAKQAILTRDHIPDSRAYVFYMRQGTLRRLTLKHQARKTRQTRPRALCSTAHSRNDVQRPHNA